MWVLGPGVDCGSRFQKLVPHRTLTGFTVFCVSLGAGTKNLVLKCIQALKSAP